MTRSDRLCSILAALQTEGWLRAEDLADTLAVSLRTIYRDMQAIADTGVPLVAVPGKGYTLHDDALPPLLLTTDEALAVLLALARMPEDVAARSAARKIRTVLPHGHDGATS